jgi:hypothetical protein
MALDFAIQHKPAIYLAYNPCSWKAGDRWRIEDVYRYPHFNHIEKFKPVYWATSKKQLGALLEECLKNPAGIERQRAAWAEFLVQSPFEQASARCVQVLFQIVKKGI